MPIIQLPANSEKLIQTPGKYLSIVNTNGQFKIAAPTFGEVIGKLGRQYVLDEITQVTLINTLAEPLEIEVESANLQIFGGGSGTVDIGNKPTIKRIEESIRVDAQATVQDGTVTSQSHDALAEIADITVNPASKLLIVPAADIETEKRTVVLQVISDTATRLRVGSNTVDAGRGAVLEGSNDAIASMEFECLAPIYVFNESGVAAKVSVMLGSR